MQLNAIEFAKLINDLRCDVRPDERRQNPRAPTRALIDVLVIDAAVKGPVKGEKLRVRDISRGGMGLLTGRSATDTTRVIVLLPKNATETLALLCKVVRNQRLPGDMYHWGTQMVRRVPAQDVAALLQGVPGVAASILTDPPPAPAQAA